MNLLKLSVFLWWVCMVFWVMTFMMYGPYVQHNSFGVGAFMTLLLGGAGVALWILWVIHDDN